MSQYESNVIKNKCIYIRYMGHIMNSINRNS